MGSRTGVPIAPKQLVTQLDIARAAGVGRATVSRALAGDTRTAEATRQTVLRVAKALGYRPNPSFGAMARARWQGRRSATTRLGVLLTDYGPQRDFALSVMTSRDGHFEASCDAFGFTYECIDIGGSISINRLRQHLHFLNVSGVVISLLPDLEASVIKVLSEWPCLGFGCCSLNPPFPLLEPDDLYGSYEVFWRVYEQGYRRIGIVQPQFPSSRGQLARLGGALAAQHEFVREKKARIPALSWEVGDVASLCTYVRTCELDAVIGYCENTLKALRQGGFSVPGDLGFAATMVHNRSCSGIYHDAREFYRRALALLASMIRQSLTANERSTLREELRFSWNDGRTLQGVGNR